MATSGTVVGLVCKKVYHIPSCLTCIITMGIQAYIINHYLVTKYNHYWYSWYAADLISIAFFIVAFVDAFRHLKKKRKSAPPPANIFGGKFGHLPFIYISWLVYSILIAIRMGIIFKYIAMELEEAMMFGPNMLKTGLSLSSIVFFFLVIAHVEAEPKSTIDQYVTAIVGRVTIDVLDSVQFMEILFINDSHVFLSFGMHNAIVAIGCINLILPAFKLAILSGWNFGADQKNTLLETLYIVFDLLIINVPFLVIRIMIWSVHSQDVSVFIIKNILSLCMTIKAIHDHFVVLSKDEPDNSESIRMDERPGQHEQNQDNVGETHGENDHLDPDNVKPKFV